MTSATQTPVPTAPSLPPGPAEELALVCRALPGKAMLGVLVVAWIVLFQFFGNSTFGYIDTPSLFGWLNYSYSQSKDDELGRYIPLIILGLCWWKGSELLAVSKRPWAGGAVIVAAALLIHLMGFAVQQTRLSVLAFYLGLCGLFGVVWGRRFLQAAFFPLFLFVFCIPLGTLADTITLPLRMLATSITSWVSQVILSVDLIQNGTQIYDGEGRYKYEVAAACGGLRSLTATFALASIYAFLTVRSPWRRLAIILSAFPLAVAGNVLRLVSIIVAAEFRGQAGGDWVHESSILGLLPYVPAFVGLGALGSWLREDKSKPKSTSPDAPIGTAHANPSAE